MPNDPTGLKIELYKAMVYLNEYDYEGMISKHDMRRWQRLHDAIASGYGVSHAEHARQIDALTCMLHAYMAHISRLNDAYATLKRLRAPLIAADASGT